MIYRPMSSYTLTTHPDELSLDGDTQVFLLKYSCQQPPSVQFSDMSWEYMLVKLSTNI